MHLVLRIHLLKYITDVCENVTCLNGECKFQEEKTFCECDYEYIGEYCEKREYTTKFGFSLINRIYN